MEEYIFEIENLDCSYNAKKIVLKVESLKIPFGKIVFVVGKSGIGKSTILETLGLMNNTILPNEKTVFLFKKNKGDTAIPLTDKWKYKGDEILSEIRLNSFSFIFQQTNLMRNFSAWDNVSITSMLQGKTGKESISRTVESLKALELIDRVHSKEDVEKLSGGQQQRLAFARAIVRDFTVLFGDEPTGNLDPVTADNVMNLLKMKLQPPKKILDKPDKSELPEEENFASAIIVSHSFDLALKFADIIVKIQTIEEQEERYGLIDQNSIFIRNEDTKDIKNSWKTSRGIISNLDLQDKLMKNGD